MIAPAFRKLLAFGGGVGISIEGPRGAEAMHVAAVRVRPTGTRLLGSFVIEDFRSQPAAEWGAAIAAMAGKLGLRHVAATVLLPRHEVILRLLALPGVADKDLEAAVAFQLDGMHPYDEADVLAGWSRLEGSDAVAVAVARREAVSGYSTLFSEAGVKLAGFTCAGPAIHSARRLFGHRPTEPVLAVEPLENGVEIYGESPSKPLFSAAFDLAPDGSPDRAIALAVAELRLESAPRTVDLSALLGGGRAYAAALSSACPHLSGSLNLLPLELRQGGSAWQWIPTAALGTAVLLGAVGLAAFPSVRNGSYLESLNREIAKVQPLAARSSAMDQEIETARARTRLLDALRQSSKENIDVLASMTNLLQPPTWLQSMDVNAAQVSVTGETDQAEPLLKAIDESALFEKSEFASPPSRSQGVERFSLRTKRTGGVQ